MRKFLTILLLITLSNTYAQKRTADQVQLRVIKNLYVRLRHLKINTDEELIWRYIYTDSSKATLHNFSKIIVKENLIVDEISNVPNDSLLFVIKVSELKKYKPEELLERLTYINDVAKYSRLKKHYASIEGSNIKDRKEYEKYKPVGKKKNAIKDEDE
jgi:hypothetical protein